MCATTARLRSFEVGGEAVATPLRWQVLRQECMDCTRDLHRCRIMKATRAYEWSKETTRVAATARLGLIVCLSRTLMMTSFILLSVRLSLNLHYHLRLG